MSESSVDVRREQGALGGDVAEDASLVALGDLHPADVWQYGIDFSEPAEEDE